MPRINHDREQRHGLHTDYFWPGEIHSVWEIGSFIEIRRERKYHQPENQVIRQVGYQITFRLGRFKLGERWEVDKR